MHSETLRNITSILAETLLDEQKIKRISLIQRFRNMRMICCNGVCGGVRVCVCGDSAGAACGADRCRFQYIISY